MSCCLTFDSKSVLQILPMNAVCSAVIDCYLIDQGINPKLTSSLKQLLLFFMKQVIKVTLNSHQIRVRSITDPPRLLHCVSTLLPIRHSGPFHSRYRIRTLRQQHNTWFIFRIKHSVVLTSAQTSQKRDKSTNVF